MSLKYKIVCKECPDFRTNKDSDYKKHCLTKKHEHNCFGTWPIKNEFKCDCGETYKHQSSLWNHKKKCSIKEKEEKEKEEKEEKERERKIDILLKNQEDMLQMLKELTSLLKSN